MKIELIQAIGRASEGQYVGWIGKLHRDIANDFSYADQTCRDLVASIRRANGLQRIDFPSGGRLHFLATANGSNRGVALDRAYVPADISDEGLAAVTPALDTSQDGAIVYY